MQRLGDRETCSGRLPLVEKEKQDFDMAHHHRFENETREEELVLNERFALMSCFLISKKQNARVFPICIRKRGTKTQLTSITCRKAKEDECGDITVLLSADKMYS